MPGQKGKPYPAGTNMVPCKTELGRFIRERRLALDLRQVPLSQLAGLGSRNTAVSAIETGAQKYLSERQLQGLARALQCDVEELRKRIPARPTVRPKTKLGKLIRSRRESLGLSRADFAKKMGATRERVRQLENGECQNIHYRTMRILAEALRLNRSVLARFVGKPLTRTTNGLGRLIRTRRKALGLSTREFAEKLGVTKQFVNQIELGQCTLVNGDDTIKRLARALQLDVDVLESVRPKKRMDEGV